MFTVAVSSRALFNIEDGHTVFVKKGFEAFCLYMRRHEKKPLRKGAAFDLISKLLSLNEPGQPERVRVMLLSSNALDAGARVIHSIIHYGLNIEQAFFTSGQDRFGLATAAEVSLFLSTNAQEVQRALERGIPGAVVSPHNTVGPRGQGLCVAFDGDSVLFSDESERVNQTEGLAAFQRNELELAHRPIPQGPFRPVLQSLIEIQKLYRDTPTDKRPLKVSLVTARGVMAAERVLRTFRSWGIHVDEALFCGGLPKGPFLNALQADLFFDDAQHNIESASPYVLACHVPFGVVGSEAKGASPLEKNPEQLKQDKVAA